MIHVECYKCERTLHEPGAIVITPPTSIGPAMDVRKLHICVDCWSDLFVFLMLDVESDPAPEPTSEVIDPLHEAIRLVDTGFKRLQVRVKEGLDRAAEQVK